MFRFAFAILLIFPLFAQAISNKEAIGASPKSPVKTAPAVAGPTEGAGTPPSWEEPGPRALTVRMGYLKPELGIDISEKNGLAQDYKLAPNTPGRTFVSASYDWFGGSISWADPTTPTDDYLYGLSSSEDLQFRVFTHKWGADMAYQRYKGYYWYEAYLQTGQSQYVPQPQFPDLETVHWGLSLNYNFHPEDFSLSAAYDQGKQQKESGWSYFLSGTINYDRFSSSQTLVPTHMGNSYGAFGSVRNGTLYSFLFGGGIGGIWCIYGNWFVSGTLMMEVGPEFKTVTRTDKTQSDSQTATLTRGKFSLGYNGKRFIVGITQQIDQSSYTIENARFTLNTQEAALFFGTRFFL